MAKKNVDVVRDYYDAINRGDVAAVLALTDEQMKWDEPQSLPWGGIYEGHEGIGQLFTALAGHLEDVHLATERLFDAGKHVVVEARVRGRSKVTGRTLDEPLIDIIALKAGKVVALRSELDTVKVLAVLS